jgi:hypothetical protein
VSAVSVPFYKDKKVPEILRIAFLVGHIALSIGCREVAILGNKVIIIDFDTLFHSFSQDWARDHSKHHWREGRGVGQMGLSACPRQLSEF